MVSVATEIVTVLWQGVKGHVAPPPPPEIDPNLPPDPIAVPAFLRREGPLRRAPGASPADWDRQDREIAAQAIWMAAVLVYDITRSRWLAERLEALAARIQTDAEG